MRRVIFLWLGLLAVCMIPGLDEFDRHKGVVLIQAVMLSSIKGAATVILIYVLACGISLWIYASDNMFLKELMLYLADCLDSIPALLWILIIVITVSWNRQVIPLLAFAVVALPPTVRSLCSEVDRVARLDFVSASHCLGLSKKRIWWRHILPNTGAIVIPLALQLAGNSIAVDGAIGLLGIGNRSDLNLGTFMVRGKERFLFDPFIFLTALYAYFVLFQTLYFLIQTGWERRIHDD